jgi:hypothetical protein
MRQFSNLDSSNLTGPESACYILRPVVFVLRKLSGAGGNRTLGRSGVEPSAAPSQPRLVCLPASRYSAKSLSPAGRRLLCSRYMVGPFTPRCLFGGGINASFLVSRPDHPAWENCCRSKLFIDVPIPITLNNARPDIVPG